MGTGRTAAAAIVSLGLRLPTPLRHGIRDMLPAQALLSLRRLLRNRHIPDDIGPIHDQLWMGYSRLATAEFLAILRSPTQSKSRRKAALTYLAIRAAEAGDYDAALSLYAAHPDLAAGLSNEQRVPQIALLNATGRGEQAEALMPRWWGAHSAADAALTRANSRHPIARGAAGDLDEVLRQVNELLGRHRLAPLGKERPGEPLSLDNLVAPAAAPGAVSGPLVTVIVSTYNAAETVRTALLSLSRQTWRDLEILVVDDCSTDRTFEIVRDFARADQRVRLIEQPQNLGTYAARNRAYGEAKGIYVTTHDSDDWAHPQRIELQVGDLEKSSRQYNLSNWVRTDPNLYFHGSWNRGYGHSLSVVNYGSLLIRRDLIDKVGPWNDVRVSGDAEFVRRLQRYLGPHRQPRVAVEAPLVLGRVTANSLTHQSATQLNTIEFGLRREYLEQATHWHARWQAGEISLEEMNRRSSWHAPASIRSVRSPIEVDLLLIADWNIRGGAFHSAFNIAKAARRQGLRLGLFHYRRHNLAHRMPLSVDVRRFAYETDAVIIAPGETVRAKTVVVTYPALFDQILDRFPKISFDRLVVLVNQMAERDVTRTDAAYDLGRVTANLVELLGTVGEWTPISNRVRDLMATDNRYPPAAPMNWTPMVDVETWLATVPAWRGGSRRQPRVGRHGRDHRLKWPGAREALLAAYCAERPCEVAFLGGAAEALDVIGRRPANWQIAPFGGDVHAFLTDLDFFVHYPHETYIEEFGRAPMEAMAAGVPVILPPVFQSTFGDAAIYAEPADVWPTIERLWRDEQAWLERTVAGRRFVAEQCSYDRLPERLGLASA